MSEALKKIFQPVFIFAIIFAWIFSGWPQVWHNLPFPPKIQKAEASHTTTFVFALDAEGWTYTDDQASCSGAFTSGTGNPAGSLQTTGSKGSGAITCNAYWEWSGTWESLGVTAGHGVTGVLGAYEYAVSDDSSNGTWNTGPYELRDSGGTLRQTLVSGLTGQTGTAGFTNRSGTEQTFTTEASNTTVRLRVNTVIVFGGGTRTWTGQNDKIAVTITHASVVAPSVTTNAATNIDTDSATLNGEITATGGEDATEHGFAYGTDSTLATVIATTTLGSKSGTGTFNEAINSLDPNTTYHFRAYATNSGGTGYGSILNFTTDALIYSVTITSSGVIEYGFVELSTATSTVGNGYTQTAQNDGNTTEKLNVKSSKLGDTNGNNLLDINEVWIYTCTTTLKQTTTNTVHVSAFSNNLKATSDATLTVNVAVPVGQNSPKLPETGGHSTFKFTVWATLGGILALLSIFFVLTPKRK